MRGSIVNYAITLHVCRSPGRIVETVMEDITELNGGGVLTVIVQNTGSITADYAVRYTHMCTNTVVYLHIHVHIHAMSCFVYIHVTQSP